MRESDLKISVSGIRGIVGQSLTPQLIIKFSEAFSSYIGGGKIAVASDTRPSRDMVRQAVFSGLMSCGADPLDLGILPIPSLQVYTREKKLDGAVSITASHNPIEWNALKLIRKGGIFLSPNEAGELLDYYYQGKFNRVSSPGMILQDQKAFGIHHKKILTLADVKMIRARNPKIVVDPCAGAAAPYIQSFCESLGAEVVCINDDASGPFPRNPEPLAENLTELSKRVMEEGADVGFAQDADADRLAAVDERGNPIGEEYTLALAVDYYLRNKRKTPVVVNLSTSRLAEEVARSAGVPCFRSKVGEIHVARMMKTVGSRIGGEGNGGIIAADVHTCRDSFSGIALLLESIAWSGQTLSGLKTSLPQFHLLKDKIRAGYRDGRRILNTIARQHLGGKIDRTDGLRVEYPDVWFHVRPSNTEPVIRIMAESRSREKAEQCLNSLRQEAL